MNKEQIDFPHFQECFSPADYLKLPKLVSLAKECDENSKYEEFISLLKSLVMFDQISYARVSFDLAAAESDYKDDFDLEDNWFDVHAKTYHLEYLDFKEKFSDSRFDYISWKDFQDSPGVRHSGKGELRVNDESFEERKEKVRKFLSEQLQLAQLNLLLQEQDGTLYPRQQMLLKMIKHGLTREQLEVELERQIAEMRLRLQMAKSP